MTILERLPVVSLKVFACVVSSKKCLIEASGLLRTYTSVYVSVSAPACTPSLKKHIQKENANSCSPHIDVCLHGSIRNFQQRQSSSVVLLTQFFGECSVYYLTPTRSGGVASLLSENFSTTSSPFQHSWLFFCCSLFFTPLYDHLSAKTTTKCIRRRIRDKYKKLPTRRRENPSLKRYI